MRAVTPSGISLVRCCTQHQSCNEGYWITMARMRKLVQQMGNLWPVVSIAAGGALTIAWVGLLTWGLVEAGSWIW